MLAAEHQPFLHSPDLTKAVDTAKNPVWLLLGWNREAGVYHTCYDLSDSPDVGQLASVQCTQARRRLALTSRPCVVTGEGGGFEPACLGTTVKKGGGASSTSKAATGCRHLRRV